jgi:hypothetical protein
VTDMTRITGISEETVRYHLERGDWPGVKVVTRSVWRIPRIVASAILAGIDPRKLKPMLANQIIVEIICDPREAEDTTD